MDYLPQMTPLVLSAGLMTAWIAEVTSRAGGYGFVLDLILGLLGSGVGGAAVWVLGFNDSGMIAPLASGFGGAALVIFTQRTLWRSTRWPGGDRSLACLRCSRPFASAGRHERMCPACRRQTA